MRVFSFSLLLLVFSTAVADDGPFVFEFEEIAPDVWAGVRPDSSRFPVMGNTTFVIGDEGVVVFDGGGMPVMSEQIIEKIRTLTKKPVTHVVISHWHGDHNFGVFRFAEEFPNVQFIAHEFTAYVMNSTRITYIDRQRKFIETNVPEFEKSIATGIDTDDSELSDVDRGIYQRIIADADAIDAEFNRSKVTPPDIVFTDDYTISSGDRNIELLYLGDANTAGDIVMWLPEERIVATGDIIVLPSPYAFNVPPRRWVETMRALNDLNYKMLVPGHGEIQTDSRYVDLVIEVAESIADQRDALLAEGMSVDEVEAALDFSAFEERFTGGDAYIKSHYDAWFEGPFRKAAMKALTGEPMVQIDPPESVPFDDERWQIEAEESELVDHLGQAALRIKGGSAVLTDADVKNGLVEFDIAVSEERGFAGLVFRVQDDRNFEHFYIRPHQSGKPDANQYTPVFDDVSGWQLYYGEEYSAPVDYRFDEWMHVKIVYAGSKLAVYIDSDEPVLRVDDLKRDDASGAIGVNSANFSVVHFANFKYAALANAYEFPYRESAATQTPDGIVTSWLVSDAFDSAVLDGDNSLNSRLRGERTWTELWTEDNGVVNLARVQGLQQGKNTVFAAVALNSDKAQSREMVFGYSDAARVYLNGTLIYKGTNGYQSRDYRYLGTIGLFDSVVLPLEKGDNEVWIAVSESFGGWGVMAEIPDRDGLSLREARR
jgi:glyoxylase-like metal-dependent hydrolase (beta-lactamase superfamily II)